MSIKVLSNYRMQNMFRTWSSVLTQVGGKVVGGSVGNWQVVGGSVVGGFNKTPSQVPSPTLYLEGLTRYFKHI